jgi:hypothetical protein
MDIALQHAFHRAARPGNQSLPSLTPRAASAVKALTASEPIVC